MLFNVDCDINIFDLNDKKISALKESVYTAELIKLLSQFGMSAEINLRNEYSDVLYDVSKGNSHAGVCTNVYGTLLEDDFSNIQKTQIVYSPVKIYFAFPKNSNKIISDAVNRHLEPLMNDDSSFYYQKYAEWMHIGAKSYPYLRLTVIILSATTIFLLIFVRILRIMVKKRTAELNSTVEALRESEAKLRAIFNSSVDAIGVSLDGIHVWMNPAYVKMFGYESESELLGKSGECLIAPECRETVLNNVRNRAAGKDAPLFYETVGLKKNGEVFDLDVHVSTYELNKINYTLTILRDITENKKTRLAIIAARDQAQKANLAKNEFLANMSHELRTPMNAILGFSNILLESPMGDSERQYLKMVIESGEHLLSIINDLLDISKIESNRLTITHAPFNPVDLIKEVAASFNKQASEKNLKLFYEIDPLIKNRLNGDAQKIKQVLFNLVGNALKFTEKGVVTLKAQLAKETKDPLRQIIKISVSDTGIGISADKQAEIFNIFYQGDLSMTKKYQGTGLGLAIVKRFLDALGAPVKVESEPGKGSIFSFEIELAAAEAPQAPDGKIVPAGETAGPPRRVLIAEDESINQTLIKKVLTPRRWLLDFAVTGGEAVEMFRKNDYDLILMDIKMPVMSGFEAMKAIRESEKGRNLPIIAVTAYAMSGEISQCFACGVSGYISKPYKAEELNAKIDELLGI
ncbi:MAG: Autoinducer 2 sensor kinase/phosphatase LuxQ [bacterium ADurb.Bin243]|nr:MAG: Autoinducer 2 sensor kinase/phosphatase LuxQ [bacterium ADurb.Bin243]